MATIVDPAPTAKRVVISQSMYFPWVGLLEQVRLADVFIHYDDVQYARGFYNRVQAKTADGVKWLTVPLREHHRGQRIDEIEVDDRLDWRGQHRAILRQAYFKAPHREEMLGLLDQVLQMRLRTLADVARESFLALVAYFNLNPGRRFMPSSAMNVTGSGSQRLLDLTLAVGGAIYVTGHGAQNYLDHDLFERSGITVQYMRYEMTPYSQLHGEFTPYVTGLDLVANCGRDGGRVIHSESVDWRDFLK
jgi:hypothetical protein